MKTFFVEKEVGLMETVRSVNRSWIYDSYFSLYRPIYPGGNVHGEMSGGFIQIPFKIVYELLNHFFVLSEKVFFREFIKSSNDVACEYKDKRKKLPNRQG